MECISEGKDDKLYKPEVLEANLQLKILYSELAITVFPYYANCRAAVVNAVLKVMGKLNGTNMLDWKNVE